MQVLSSFSNSSLLHCPLVKGTKQVASASLLQQTQSLQLFVGCNDKAERGQAQLLGCASCSMQQRMHGRIMRSLECWSPCICYYWQMTAASPCKVTPYDTAECSSQNGSCWCKLATWKSVGDSCRVCQWPLMRLTALRLHHVSFVLNWHHLHITGLKWHMWTCQIKRMKRLHDEQLKVNAVAYPKIAPEHQEAQAWCNISVIYF